MPPISIIEHLVLFKLRPSTDPSTAAATLSALRSLSSLPLLPYLAAGPIRLLRSPATNFTHLLHARFLSQSDLASYAIHPSHLSVVRRNSPFIEDILAVDWIADLDSDRIVPPPGSAMRFLIARPAEGIQAAEIVKAIDAVRVRVRVRVREVSRGVNFSQERAKGYEVGLVLGVEEMDGVEGEEEIGAIEERIRGLVESVIVVDFVVPSAGL